MTTTHTLGFPRIGARRELKFALEAYWKGESSREALMRTGAQLRRRHWQDQAGIDLVPVGDFSFYDQMLDMSFTLGNLPERVRGFHGDALDNYFRVARGRSAEGAEAHAPCCGGVAAGEMTSGSTPTTTTSSPSSMRRRSSGSTPRASSSSSPRPARRACRPSR